MRGYWFLGMMIFVFIGCGVSVDSGDGKVIQKAESCRVDTDCDQYEVCKTHGCRCVKNRCQQSCEGTSESCGSQETCCQGIGCFNLREKVSHCGKCGRACKLGEICVDGRCSGDCASGAFRCSDGKVFRCDGNQWVGGEVCEGGVSCKSETSCGECKDGALVCEDGGERHCMNGQWGELVLCKDGEGCDVESNRCVKKSDVVCVLGERKCEGKELKKCGSDGKFVIEKSCASDEVCDVDKGCVGGEVPVDCKLGERKCEGKELKKCGSDGKFGLEAECKSAALCDAEKGCQELVEECSKDVCRDGIFMKCVDGKHAFPVNCESGVCKDGERCRGCAENVHKCDGVKVISCGADGEWMAAVDCAAGYHCKDGVGCVKRDDYCDVDLCKDGMFKKCVGHVYQAGVNCTDNSSCKSVTACGECVNGVKKCEGKVYYNCVEGHWTLLENCKDKCDSKLGCVECFENADCKRYGDNYSCSRGRCECTPDCNEKSCGWGGCFPWQCGRCDPSNDVCTEDGKCVNENETFDCRAGELDCGRYCCSTGECKDFDKNCRSKV